MKQPLLQLRKKSGTALHAADVLLIPQSYVLEFHTRWGGLVWNRPHAIRIVVGDKQSSVRIPDITFYSLLIMGLFSLAAFLFTVGLRGRSSVNG